MKFALMDIKIYTILLWENMKQKENVTVSLETYPHVRIVDLDRSVAVVPGGENGLRLNRPGTVARRTGNINKHFSLECPNLSIGKEMKRLQKTT